MCFGIVVCGIGIVIEPWGEAMSGYGAVWGTDWFGVVVSVLGFEFAVVLFPFFLAMFFDVGLFGIVDEVLGVGVTNGDGFYGRR